MELRPDPTAPCVRQLVQAAKASPDRNVWPVLQASDMISGPVPFGVGRTQEQRCLRCLGSCVLIVSNDDRLLGALETERYALAACTELPGQPLADGSAGEQ